MVPNQMYQDALSSGKDEGGRQSQELERRRNEINSLTSSLQEVKGLCSMQQMLISQKDNQIQQMEKIAESLKQQVKVLVCVGL